MCVLTFGTDTKQQQHHFFLKVPKYLSSGMCRPPSVTNGGAFCQRDGKPHRKGKKLGPLTVAFELGMVQIMELVTACVVLKPGV